MMLENASDIFEVFKNFPVSVTVLFVIPFVILSGPVSTADAAHEFKVYRMQHFDLHGTAIGSRSALVNMEARPIESEVLTRRCIIAKLSDLSIDRYKEIISQGAGAIVILLPENPSAAPPDEIEQWEELESQLMQQEVPIAVYFAYEDENLIEIHKHINNAITSDQAGTAAEALLSVASASGYQMVTNSAEAKQVKDFMITSIQGKLTGQGIEEHMPTLAFVAHYDTFGMAPSLARGADSNGSGVVALLELARLFSKLYSDSRTQAKYNILFVLSGGGKFNYQGTKKWIEDNLESSEGSLLNDVEYVLCLDSIAATDNLYLHVSKPPKEGTRSYDLVNELKQVSKAMFPHVNFTLVHKKINLAEEILAWEHEKFSVRRLPAGTLSHYENPHSLGRNSIFDERSKLDVMTLERNIKLIAEATARHIFNLSGKGYQDNVQVFHDGLALKSDLITSWLDFMASQPRATQFVTKDSVVLQGLEQTLTKYVREVKKTMIKADKRDPEFVFYDSLETTMFAYKVKPALFDLFLAVGISAYLSVVYLAVQNFSLLTEVLPKFVTSPKSKYA